MPFFLHSVATILCVLVLVWGCNDTSLSGSSSRKPDIDQPQKVDNLEGTPKDLPEAQPPSGPIPPVEPNDSLVQNNVEITPPEIVPDEIVDGIELINDCGRCVERAKQLASRVPFEATKEKTYNLGFYKVDPSRGLCDVHFMSDMRIPIDDHDGIDSILNGQIAVYCPCNCGWAATPSSGAFGDPFGPFGDGFGPGGW